MTANIIILLSAFLGYIVIFLAFNNYRNNRILNSFLLFIFLISSTLLMTTAIADIYNIADLKAFYLKSNIYTTLFVPCFYLYFKYLIRDRQHFLFKDFLHPIFLFLAILEREFLLIDTILGCKLNYFFSQFFAIYIIVYDIKIFQLLKQNVWNKKAILSAIKTQNKLIKKWTILLFFALIIISLRFFLLYYKEYLFYEPLIIEPTKYLWVTALVWIVLFLIIFSNPAILYGYSYLQTELSKKTDDSISNNYWNVNSKIQINNNQDQLLKEKISSKIEPYLSELNTLLYQNSYFTDPQFSVKDLAQVLNIPNSHLQYIFKYHSKLSFSDYKKISRIQNSLELINNNYLATNTMESLSKAVGFSSYNPFFTCFKDVVGKSPHQYISSLSIKNDK